MLAAAVAVGFKTALAGYEVAKIGKLLDYLTFSGEEVVNLLIKKGFPISKVGLGFGKYGRGFVTRRKESS